MSKPIVLKIFRNGGVVDIKQFVTETHIVLGSSETDTHVKLPGQLSPFHASIDKRGDKYFLTDLGSQQGTYLKGNKVLESALEHGDKIAIGEYIIEFYIGAPGPAVVAPPPATATPKPIVTHAPTAGAAPKPTPAPAAIPRVQSSVSVSPMGNVSVGVGGTSSGRRVKGQKTFAPQSSYKNLSEFIKPTKGSTIEVLVAWKERVIGSYHFHSKGTYYYGSHPSCEVLVPSVGTKVNKAPLLQIEGQASVLIPPGMAGSLVVEGNTVPLSQLYTQGRLQAASAGGSKLTLAQGEMVRIQLADGVELVVRYCSETPKPVFIPFIDFASNGFLAVLLACILAIVVSLYVALNKSEKPVIDDEEYRTALIIDNPPKPPPMPPQPKMEVPPEPPKELPPPPPKKVVQETPKETPKESPKTAEKKLPPSPTPNRQATKQQTAQQKSGGGGDGKAAQSMAPTNKPKSNVAGSVKKGGAVKTTNAPAAQAQSTTKDISKSSIFSTFGSAGKQDRIGNTYSGEGELAGEAARATGKSGYNEDRAGQGLGSKLAEVGSGSGKGNQGISGAGNGTGLGFGKGAGGNGFGGVGLGGKGSVTIVPGGGDESYGGNIDRNGIRQVFLNNQRALQSCYEGALAADKALSGKLVLDFDIGEQGRVLRADYSREKSTMNNSQLANCVINRMKNWRFPEPPQNQTVQVFYPLAFSGK